MCNRWCLDFARLAVPHVARPARVLEVGSLDVNGSVRSELEPLASSYVGVDIRPGRGVDEVLDVARLRERFGPEAFDLVASTEMLEHCEDWAGAVFQMLAVLRPGGLLVLTTRSPGFPFHDHPADYWRFTDEDVRSLLDPLGAVLELESDHSLGWPCGIGVVFRRTAAEAALSDWLGRARGRPLLRVDPVRDAFTPANSHLIPFHESSVYRACAQAVRDVVPGGARVLDASARPESLLRVAGVHHEIEHRPLASNAAPAGSGPSGGRRRFGGAVAVDTVHLLPAAERARAVEALCEQADTVVVAGPCAEDHGGRLLHQWLLRAHASTAEAAADPPPSLAELVHQFEAAGRRVQTFAHGHLAWLLPLLDLWRWHAARQDLLEPLRDVVARCSRLLAPLDDLEPACRRVLVATPGEARLPARPPRTAETYREAAARWAECWEAAAALLGPRLDGRD